VKPTALMVALRWMIPASSAPERAALLAGMQQSAPPQIFEAVLAAVRPHLDAKDWAKLSAALGPTAWSTAPAHAASDEASPAMA
jgi:hypothetical protein